MQIHFQFYFLDHPIMHEGIKEHQEKLLAIHILRIQKMIYFEAYKFQLNRNTKVSK